MLDDAVGVRQSLLRLLLLIFLAEFPDLVKLAVSKAGFFYLSDKRVGTHPELFFTMSDNVYSLPLKAARLDKEIALLVRALPPGAVNHYIDSSLIDEIVFTNDIEGVRSSRREISEVLDSLSKRVGKRRFRGLVQKYVMLSSGQAVSLQTCYRAAGARVGVPLSVWVHPSVLRREWQDKQVYQQLCNFEAL